MKLDSLILNVPHSSTFVPELSRYTSNAWWSDLITLTDWATEEFASISEVSQHVASCSRVWCDVERFPDHMEPLVEKGHGFYYTHNLAGEQYREINTPETLELKSLVYAGFYWSYHEDLKRLLLKKLESHAKATIIDVHSFTDTSSKNPFEELPDICIGIDPFHTPEFLKYKMLQGWRDLGYTVEINRPFEGSFVPQPMYKKDARVQSVMIEFNKRLYMNALEVTTPTTHHAAELLCRTAIRQADVDLLRRQLHLVLLSLDNPV